MAFLMSRYVPSMSTFWRVFNHKWILNFVKNFLMHLLRQSCGFYFQISNMVYHNDGFSDTEPSSHPWDKSQWIMLYDPSNVLLDSVNICWGFLHLCSSVILAYNFLFCDMFVWFYYLADIGLIELVEKNLFLHNFGE